MQGVGLPGGPSWPGGALLLTVQQWHEELQQGHQPNQTKPQLYNTLSNPEIIQLYRFQSIGQLPFNVRYLRHSCDFCANPSLHLLCSWCGNLYVDWYVDHVPRSWQHFLAIFQTVLLWHSTIQYNSVLRLARKISMQKENKYGRVGGKFWSPLFSVTKISLPLFHAARGNAWK